MSLRVSSVCLLIALSSCFLGCGAAPRAAAPGASAFEAPEGGGRSKLRGLEPESSERSEPGRADARDELSPVAGTAVEFLPLSEPVPEHGVGRTVSVVASEGAADVHLAAQAGVAREGSVAASGDR